MCMHVYVHVRVRVQDMRGSSVIVQMVAACCAQGTELIGKLVDLLPHSLLHLIDLHFVGGIVCVMLLRTRF